MKSVILYVGLSLIFILNIKAQTHKYWIRTSVDSVIISDSDLPHFWRAFDSCMQTNDTTIRKNFIQKYYFDSATIGLKGLIEQDSKYLPMLTAYSRAIKRDKYWKSIRATTYTFINKSDSLRNAYKKLKSIYPAATFSDVYILATPFMHGGTPVNGGFIIGVDMISKTAASDFSQFSKAAADFLSRPEYFIPLIIHENTHTMQKQDDESTLLSRSLIEGAADYITYLTIGKTATQKNIYDYGFAHEKELWNKFKLEKDSSNFAEWYMSDGGKGPAPDLGYFIGFEICDAYYKNAKNKSKAIKDIVELTIDPELFLTNSQYANKFK
jgi:hypothetical protein